MVGTNEFVLLSALHNICKGLDLTQRKIKRAAVTDKKQASEVSRSVDTVIGIRSGRTGNEIVVFVKTKDSTVQPAFFANSLIRINTYKKSLDLEVTAGFLMSVY